MAATARVCHASWCAAGGSPLRRVPVIAPSSACRGLFLFEGVPAKGQTAETLETALREQITRVQSEPVDPAELERVRNQVIAAKVFERDSLFYQAMQIGLLETIGLDWRLADTYVDRLAEVTPEQIQAVARKYLTPERLTVAILDPQPLESKTQAAANTQQGASTHVR
jgi:zinc protease